MNNVAAPADPVITARSHDAIRMARAAIEAGTVLHLTVDGLAITAGRVAVSGGEPRWCAYVDPGKGAEVAEDDFGTAPALARGIVRTYGAVRVSRACVKAAFGYIENDPLTCAR